MNKKTTYENKRHQPPLWLIKRYLNANIYLQSTRHKIHCCKSNMKRT